MPRRARTPSPAERNDHPPRHPAPRARADQRRAAITAALFALAALCFLAMLVVMNLHDGG